jgi:hypothetical protein
VGESQRDSFVPRYNRDFYIDATIEPVNNGHKPIYGESFQMGVADARKLAGLYAYQLFGLADGQLPVIEYAL